MKQLTLSTLLFTVFIMGCHESVAPGAPDQPQFASSGGSGLYQLRFIVEDPSIQGEITSNFFPSGGVKLNTSDPWRNLKVSGAIWSLNNFTHGQLGQGTCTVSTDVPVTWDIAGTDPIRSFMGEWGGTVTFWRTGGMNFYLEGTRTSGVGSIGNAASNGNHAEEFRAPDKSYFKIRFTNARVKFGGASYPDGNGTLAELPGAETACANFTIEAVRLP